MWARWTKHDNLALRKIYVLDMNSDGGDDVTMELILSWISQIHFNLLPTRKLCLVYGLRNSNILRLVFVVPDYKMYFQDWGM